MITESSHYGLISGPVSTDGFDFLSNDHAAPAIDKDFNQRSEGYDFDVGVVSFKLVSKVYEWFEFTHEDIPYTEEGDTDSIISEKRIISVG